MASSLNRPVQRAHAARLLQVFQFMGVTVTNVLANKSVTAAGISSEERAERMDSNSRLVSYSFTFALLFGVVVALSLWFGGPWLLAAMGTNADMAVPALEYLRIRALAAPAVIAMNVCQVRTPRAHVSERCHCAEAVGDIGSTVCRAARVQCCCTARPCHQHEQADLNLQRDLPRTHRSAVPPAPRKLPGT